MKKIMKVMTMVLFVVSMTAVTSCTKDNANLIIGRWKMSKITGSSHGVTYSMSINEFMEAYGEGDTEDFIIEFKNDGKVYVGNDSSHYSVSGNKLTVTEGEISVQLTIKKLTVSKLVLVQKEDDVDMAIEFQRL